jgi:hypothetical protein
VVEELWQFLQGSEGPTDIHSENEDSDEDLMAISVNAVQGT